MNAPLSAGIGTFTAMQSALFNAALHGASAVRLDAVDESGKRYDLGTQRAIAWQDAVQRGNALTFSEARALSNKVLGVQRADDSFAFAGDLRHIYNETLREERPVPNGVRLFTVDRSVSPGARTHTVRRLYSSAKAGIHRAGNDIPYNASVKQVEQDFPVRTLITGFTWDMFQEMSAEFANFGLVSELARAARDAIETLFNDLIWNGSNDDGLYGIKNYPWLARKVSTVAFYGTPADTRVQVAELGAWVNYAPNASKQRMMPTHMVMSPRLHQWLGETLMGTTSQLAQGSILEMFVKNHPGITIELAWEMEDFGGDGVDGVLLYNKSRNGIANVIPMDISALPVEREGFLSKQAMFMQWGGLVMRDVGSNLLVLVDIEA